MKCEICGDAIGHNGKYWIHLTGSKRHAVVLPKGYSLNDLSTKEKNMKEPKYIPVDSSHLKAISYDVTFKYLFVVFKGNAKYRYSNVTAEQFCKLLLADSVGKYFNSNIKSNPKVHKFVKVS